jgi:hypothetical protein
MSDLFQNLASHTKRFERFLTELVNLRDDLVAIRRFLKRFSDFDLTNQRLASLPQYRRVRIQRLSKNEELETELIPYLRTLFRAAWTEPDRRNLEWACANLRLALARNTELLWWPRQDGLFAWHGNKSKRLRLAHAPLDELPITKAFEYLVKNSSNARSCANRDCPAPYFFAVRHSQRYCSEKCAQSGQKASKRKWWTEHGAEWRKRNTREKAKKTSKKVVRQAKGK